MIFRCHEEEFHYMLTKGLAGERWFSKELTKEGYKVYSDLKYERETADIIAIKDGNIHLFHVKRKKRRNSYTDTGMDTRHLYQYMELHEKNDIESTVVFIDEHPDVMQVYTIPLIKFNELCYESWNIFYVDLKHMTKYCDITKDTIDGNKNERSEDE